jgi:hypothetical protein
MLMAWQQPISRGWRSTPSPRLPRFSRTCPPPRLQAQYSLRFALAARIAKGHVGPDEITGPGLSDPDVAAMMDRIAIAEDPRHSTRFPGGSLVGRDFDAQRWPNPASGDVHARGGPEAPYAPG